MRMETPEIYDRLQRKLTTAGFVPGQKLKPSDLQGEFGCSANTIRDVLLRLSTVGLVQFEMQRGFRVAESSPEKRSDIARFRTLLEQEGAAASMAYGGVAWEALLSASHHKLMHIETQIAHKDMSEADMALWSDAEREFHETIISACQSPALISSYQSIYLQFRQQMLIGEREFSHGYFEAIIREHQAILDAALSGDVAACKQAIHDHMKRNF
ncbi:MAG: GntR family transcriptional regulator [Paracoccaceae bacterium]